MGTHGPKGYVDRTFRRSGAARGRTGAKGEPRQLLPRPDGQPLCLT
jgi:hypothetical protein